MFTGEPVPRMEVPWLVALPMFACLVGAALARWPNHRAARVLGWSAVVPAAAALALAPPTGYLHQHVATILRIGFAEARLDLVLERPTALLLVASAVTVAFFGATARRVGLLALGWTILLVDDRMLAAIGWACLVAIVVRSRLGRIASASAGAAAALLFWVLGGAYTGEGYAPDMGPRVIAIVSGEAAPVVRSAFEDDDDDDEVAMPQYGADDRGLFAVRALPGSSLYVDGARTPFGGPHPVLPPFEGQPIPVGYHTFRLHPGQAYDDYVVNQLRVDPGQRVTLVTAGSTTSSADARDALQAKIGDSAPFAESLRARKVFGVRAAVVVALLLLLAGAMAGRDPLLAIVAVGVASPFVAVIGPCPEVAVAALVCGVVPGLLGGRADALVGVAAVLAGAPVPAALALAMSAWLTDSRAAALASVLPRAALVAAIGASGGTFGRVGAVVAFGVTALSFASDVRAAIHIPKWYAASFVVAAVGALAIVGGWPPAWALALAAGASLPAFARPPRWRAARPMRLRMVATVLRPASSLVRLGAGGIRRLAPWVAFLIALLAAGDALAAPSLHVSNDGPVVLASKSGSWVGTLDVRNDGDAPLHLLRISVRDADVDPALARVHAELSSGLAEVVIAPGGTATIDVYWAPAKDERTRAVRGHVLLTSNDPAVHVRAVAFRADRGEGWGRALFSHLLALLVGVPALAAVLLLLRRGRERSVALAAACVTAALGWGVARAFDPSSAALQLVERAVLSQGAGVELFLGVDGTSIAAVAQVALLLPVAVLLVPRDRGPLAHAAVLGLGAVVLLALLSIDAAVVIFAVAASVALLAILAVAVGAPRVVIRRFVVVSTIGVVAFAIAVGVLHSAADAGWLVDGSPAAPWSATELARTAFLAKGAPVTVAWSLLFVAAAALGGIAPVRLVDEERPVVALAVIAFFLRLGPHVLLRWAIPILPEATRWAAPVVLSLSVLAVALGAIASIGAREGTLARATFGAAAVSFAAVATLTPQGFAAATLYGPFAAVAGAVALVGPSSGRRATNALVVTGAGYAAVLAVIAIAARSPAAAVVLALALAGHASGVAHGSRKGSAFAVAALMILCALAGFAVDAVAPTARAWADRISRVGGDALGA